MIVRALVLAAGCVLPGAASAMDLMDLYREARSHDARYAAARAQFRAAQEAVPQARAGVASDVGRGGTVKRRQSLDVAGSADYRFGRRHRYRSELLRPNPR